MNRGREAGQMDRASALLEVRTLHKRFPVKGGWFARPQQIYAVDGIDLSVPSARTVGLVGESGCGKTTTARLIAKLCEPDSGEIRFGGHDISTLRGDALRNYRRNVQMVFQDPFESLNPRRSILQILSQPFINYSICSGSELRDRVGHLLQMVGLHPESIFIDRYPHQLSGGQRQRVGIARAIALSPRLLIADEPVASLDISVRAQILNLLKTLQGNLQLSYLLITHDLAVVRSLCDTTAVMYMGKIIEYAATESLFGKPMHPYTQALISATPLPNPRRARARRRIVLSGEIPSPLDPPSGCRFHTRCPYAEARCRGEEPALRLVGSGHQVACHFAEQLLRTENACDDSPIPSRRRAG
jgi:oligopeptide/dipeptide ABC transporter ATP-binding protein